MTTKKEELFIKYSRIDEMSEPDYSRRIMSRNSFFAALDEHDKELKVELSKLKKYKYGVFCKFSDIEKIIGGLG
jgi:hypothetical protein